MNQRLRVVQGVLKGALRQVGRNLLALVIASSAVIYAHGLSVYWYATPNGITFQNGWLASPTTYDWSAVNERHVTCMQADAGGAVEFRVRFRDGSLLDMTDSDGNDFIAHFSQISDLTRAAPVFADKAMDKRFCPAFIQKFLAENPH